MNEFVELNDEKKAIIKKTAETAKVYSFTLLVSVIASLAISFIAIINLNASIGGLLSTFISLTITTVLAVILFLFNRHVKNHLETNDSHSLHKGLYKLKWFFTFKGILYVIVIGLVLLSVFLFLLIAAENL